VSRSLNQFSRSPERFSELAQLTRGHEGVGPGASWPGVCGFKTARASEHSWNIGPAGRRESHLRAIRAVIAPGGILRCLLDETRPYTWQPRVISQRSLFRRNGAGLGGHLKKAAPSGGGPGERSLTKPADNADPDVRCPGSGSAWGKRHAIRNGSAATSNEALRSRSLHGRTCGRPAGRGGGRHRRPPRPAGTTGRRVAAPMLTPFRPTHRPGGPVWRKSVRS
jgi:hypothetical protein